MKRIVSVVLILMLFSSFLVYAETDENYGYVSSDFIILNEDEASDSIIIKEFSKNYSAYALPDKYDARDEDRIFYSGVGQSYDGTCWTFASTLCAETALGGKINLSENHIKYAASYIGNNKYGYIRTPDDGGNFSMYLAYASNWRGPVLEVDDVYEYGYTNRDYESVTAKKPVAYHIQGALDLPNLASRPDLISSNAKEARLEVVKYYIKKYGCVFSAIYWGGANLNYTTKAYYNSDKSSEENHAINLIGWDDNYPRENFNTDPGRDGAFIIKNSQGLKGEYMYLSYEDAYAGWAIGAVTSIEDKYNYGDVYSHDSFQPGAGITIASGMAKTTNVFASKYDDEYISAVSVTTKSWDLSYKIYISTTADGNEKNENKYTLCGSGYIEEPGLHTLKLNDNYELGDKGTRFCVRIIFESPEEFVVPLEYKTGTIPATYAEAGQSYLASGNYTGSDMGVLYDANLYVKAYTDVDYEIDFETDYILMSINDSEFIPGMDATVGLNDKVQLKFTNPTHSYFINGEKYSVDDDSTTIDATIIVTENLLIESVPESVTGVSLEKTSVSMSVGETEKLVATVSPDKVVNKNVIWTSSDEAVATVSNDGVVTAKAPGTAVITVTTEDGGKTAECQITVIQPVTGILLNKKSTTLSVGSTETLTAVVSPENATNKSVIWTSSDEAVATVSNGVVTAKATGTAVITAITEDGGKIDKCIVLVNESSISLFDYSEGDNIDFRVSLPEDKGYLLAVVFDGKGKMIDVKSKPAQNGTQFLLSAANGERVKILWLDSVLNPYECVYEKILQFD